MHEGWYNAANKTIDYINEYISANRITGKIKVWIAGFSRGGATANLAAGLLDNKILNDEEIFSNDVTLTRDDLYAYTFEAPQGANYNSETVEKPGSELYNNIYNVVNPNDLVPKGQPQRSGAQGSYERVRLHQIRYRQVHHHRVL